jgi:hypothetical protein
VRGRGRADAPGRPSSPSRANRAPGYAGVAFDAGRRWVSR